MGIVHPPQDVSLMVLRFLHLSDIHFGQEKDGTLITHKFVRDELVKDVKKLAGQRGPASRVIVTGDVAYSGKLDQYSQATAWLEKITSACGLGDTHVSTIPGNHDCDLAAISNQAKMIQAKFRTNDADQVRTDLNGIYQGCPWVLNHSPIGSRCYPPPKSTVREFAMLVSQRFISLSKPISK
jgi:metallophosphoesterase superfamily enzyme